MLNLEKKHIRKVKKIKKLLYQNNFAGYTNKTIMLLITSQNLQTVLIAHLYPAKPFFTI
jgi:hypothetical protein